MRSPLPSWGEGQGEGDFRGNEISKSVSVTALTTFVLGLERSR